MSAQSFIAYTSPLSGNTLIYRSGEDGKPEPDPAFAIRCPEQPELVSAEGLHIGMFMGRGVYEVCNPGEYPFTGLQEHAKLLHKTETALGQITLLLDRDIRFSTRKCLVKYIEALLEDPVVYAYVRNIHIFSVFKPGLDISLTQKGPLIKSVFEGIHEYSRAKAVARHAWERLFNAKKDSLVYYQQHIFIRCGAFTAGLSCVLSGSKQPLDEWAEVYLTGEASLQHPDAPLVVQEFRELL